MTPYQVTEILDLIHAAAVPAEWPDGLLAQAVRHVRVLPYEWALERARRWAAQPAADASGRAQPKFLNTLPEVLTAVGVPPSRVVRDAIVKAAHTEGASVLPDLRAENGLSYVGRNDALPQGVVEWLALNNQPIPNRPVALAIGPPSAGAQPIGALPAPKGEAMPMSQALAEMKSKLANGHKLPAKRQPSGIAEVDDLDDLLQRDTASPNLVAAIQRLTLRYKAQITALEDQRRIYEERLAELSDTRSIERSAAMVKAMTRRARAEPGGILVMAEAFARGLDDRFNDVRVKTLPHDPLIDDTPARLVIDCRVARP